MMTSNGYLFNENLVNAAVSQWNLKMVQITLDGTEKVYNKIKAFIYPDSNAYQTVMHNIQLLLDAGIKVHIRLNLDLYNADDLMCLADELSERFSHYNNINVYAHHLFEDGTPIAELHTEEEWNARDAVMCRLEEKLNRNGLVVKQGISKRLKMNQCMADSGDSITILPDGNIGLCEHFTESEFIGHISSETFDSSVISEWKSTIPEVPECAKCFLYPECIKLKKCTNASVCYPHYRIDRLRKVTQRILCEYEKWHDTTQDSLDEEFPFDS